LTPSNRKLRNAIDDFTGLIQLEILNESTLGEVVERIKKAKAPAFRRLASEAA